MNRETQKAVASVIALSGERAKREPEKSSPIGTDRGNFQRGPCGECWHWKRVATGALDQGTCMAGPPVAFPVQVQGQMAQALTRPVLPAAHEGCDEWDDSDAPDDGGGEVAAAVKAGGTG